MYNRNDGLLLSRAGHVPTFFNRSFPSRNDRVPTILKSFVPFRSIP